jgi:hypothetical protein
MSSNGFPSSNAGVILDGSEITIPEFLHGLPISSDSNHIIKPTVL